MFRDISSWWFFLKKAVYSILFGLDNIIDFIYENNLVLIILEDYGSDQN